MKSLVEKHFNLHGITPGLNAIAENSSR